MKHGFIFIFWNLFAIFGVIAPIPVICNSEVSKVPSINDRSLSPYISPSSEQEIFFAVMPNGTINLMESDSGNTIWSFSSGSSLSSLYLGPAVNGSLLPYPINKYCVDHGNDFVHNENLGEMNILKMVDNYVTSGPHTSKYEFTRGTKRTTIFRVDAKSGSLINIFKPDDFRYKLGGLGKGENNVLSEQNTENVLQLNSLNQKSDWSIFFVRVDYGLRSFSLNSGEVLLDGMISDVRAFFRYNESDCSLSEIKSRPSIDLGSDQEPYFVEQLRVVQIRDCEIFRALFRLGIINGTHYEFWGAHERSEGHPLYPHENINNYRELLTLPASFPDPEPSTDTHGKGVVPYRFQENKDRGYNVWLVPLIIRDLGFLALLVFVIWHKGKGPLTAMKQNFTQQLDDSRGKKTPVSKRKKARKVGNFKNTANTEKLDKSVSVEEVENPNSFQSFQSNGKETWSNLAGPGDGYAGGLKIGKLLVSNKEIAKGSNGTVVLEGMYDGRRVAVKRLVQAHNDVASKEIQNLIASDRHPNIVRWYGVEYDSYFVYLSLELCTCSLNDLIFKCSDSSRDLISSEGGKSMNSVNGYTIQLHSLKGIDKDVELWKPNGYPSCQFLKLMRDVISGLAHLHELGIVHRDLKPQNILIIKERTLCAKISDMGLSKSLVGEKSSLGNHATGYGSSGWQAPEQLLHGRQTRAVDLFSLGCVLFFCITGGKHPFGDHLERDINIVKNQVDLFIVEHIPEAVDLFSHMLNPDPELRPKALDVLCHPLFWTSEMRLSFLRDASDRVELEDRENESELLKALEKAAPVALGGHWDEKMEATFINNIGRYRRYKFDSARDLLRVIRNKLNHYRELPKDIKEIIGPVPEGYDNYFASRFPRFLIEVYKVTNKYCQEEDWFWKYCKSRSI